MTKNGKAAVVFITYSVLDYVTDAHKFGNKSFVFSFGLHCQYRHCRPSTNLILNICRMYFIGCLSCKKIIEHIESYPFKSLVKVYIKKTQFSPQALTILLLLRGKCFKIKELTR